MDLRGKSVTLAAAIAASLIVCGVAAANQKGASTKSGAAAQARSEPPTESGVYGFAGAGVPDSEPEGVIGECVWIFDEGDHTQLAKGVCRKRDPGKYRVVLKPGHYVLHGPGGSRKVEIKAGEWVKVDSVASLPMAP